MHITTEEIYNSFLFRAYFKVIGVFVVILIKEI